MKSVCILCVWRVRKGEYRPLLSCDARNGPDVDFEPCACMPADRAPRVETLVRQFADVEQHHLPRTDEATAQDARPCPARRSCSRGESDEPPLGSVSEGRTAR